MLGTGCHALPPTGAAGSSSQTFRDMEICPSPDELLCVLEEQPLRKNTGRYRNAEDYLDLQFQLIREDFVRPLREAIAEVHCREETDAEDSDCDEFLDNPLQSSLKVYKEVRFVKLQPDVRALTIGVLIGRKQINYANSRIFMYGSLLCFSATEDNFGSILLAKVSNCSPTLLRSGLLGVTLIKRADILNIKFDASYSMFESKAFFEKYFHILTALQTMELKNYPMCEYVTGRTTTVKKINGKRCGVIENPGLNASQFKAYCSALLNDLTVIQGPPGTGKTHLALKVVERMIELDEEQELISFKRPPPILVICGTNHALDQFLERIVVFCKRLIRFGGQSQSTALEAYTMRSKREANRHQNNDVFMLRQIKSTMLSLHWAIEKEVIRLNSGILLKNEEMVIKKRILPLIDRLYKQINLYQEHKLRADLSLMHDVRLIGMTTSGAARLRPLLECLGPKIMIVEEAAAVLEGDVVGALTKHCKQIVLIGDHKQLRPMTSCYHIGKKYHLDVSLFERLYNNGVPHITLDMQHRMRPEFADLLVPSIYTTLHTDISACDRPDVPGVAKNLFFVSHCFQEESLGSGKKNIHEAEFLMALCHYLILQGNKPENITVIAMYDAQVKELRSLGAQEKLLKGVLISSVDGYQGKENDIVLLSLVRSNVSAKIGFLSTVNRVCVALSRARLGLYIVGNMENLTRDEQSVWRGINKSMVELQSVSENLKLCCSKHGFSKYVNSAADFQLNTDCGLDCNSALLHLEGLFGNLTVGNTRKS